MKEKIEKHERERERESEREQLNASERAREKYRKKERYGHSVVSPCVSEAAGDHTNAPYALEPFAAQVPISVRISRVTLLTLECYLFGDSGGLVSPTALAGFCNGREFCLLDYVNERDVSISSAVY